MFIRITNDHIHYEGMVEDKVMGIFIRKYENPQLRVKISNHVYTFTQWTQIEQELRKFPDVKGIITSPMVAFLFKLYEILSFPVLVPISENTYLIINGR